MKPNTAIFLQDRFSDDDAWECDVYAFPTPVKWTNFEFKERKHISKRDGFKFGFVIKSLKTK